MSFWDLENLDTETGSFETGGGSEPIPAGTQLKAVIDEIKWDTWEGDEYISARWTIVDGDYKNRKVFHKIRVNDTDQKKAEKAKRMLAAIATNAGGGLLKLQNKPTDGELQQHLLHKPMAIMVQVWEIDGKSGNWVSAVAPLQQAPKTTADDDYDPFA